MTTTSADLPSFSISSMQSIEIDFTVIGFVTGMLNIVAVGSGGRVRANTSHGTPPGVA
ncbi:MAG TPA: hypothetical protein VN517_17025 [Terriglobales bacterium]|nr:hypothetical protein [Terriglobales bacterium]